MHRIMGRMLGVLLAVSLAGGCSGILTQNIYDDGRIDRFRLAGAPRWSSYDRNPIKADETCLMIKKEMTF